MLRCLALWPMSGPPKGIAGRHGPHGPSRRSTLVELTRSGMRIHEQRSPRWRTSGECNMDESIVGLAAVVLFFGIPLAAMYTFYRVRKLRTDERLAALARGVSVAIEPDLN